MANKKMSKSTKTLLGVGTAVAVGAGAFFLLSGDANASDKGTKPEDPADPSPELPPGDDDAPEDPADPPPPPSVTTPPEPGEKDQKRISRPSGNPGSAFNCSKKEYDTSFWDAGTPEQNRQRVIDVFSQLGYDFNGATKTNGTFKKSGTVKRFQEDYNLVSAAGTLGIPSMGGLAMDGVVGPCTLNAMQLLLYSLDDPSLFRPAGRSLRL